MVMWLNNYLDQYISNYSNHRQKITQLHESITTALKQYNASLREIVVHAFLLFEHHIICIGCYVFFE